MRNLKTFGHVVMFFGWPALFGALVAVVLTGPEVYERDFRTVLAAWFVATYLLAVLRLAWLGVAAIARRFSRRVA